MYPDQQTLIIHEGVDSAHESKEGEEINKLCKIKVLIKIYTYLTTVANIEVDEEDGMHTEEGSITELYPQTNIPLVRHHTYIISDTGRVADVTPFTPDYASM